MNTHHLRRTALLLILFHITLFAQVQRDPVPLKSWPAPLYWQPTPSESEAAEARLMVAGNVEKRSASSNVTTDAQIPVGALVFVAMTPCRLVDTRTGQGFTGAFGPPSLVGGASRTFPIQFSTTCSIPPNAQAYSFNVTVVPPGTTFPGNVNPSGALGYLTIWPTGVSQPNASALNSFLGTVVANAAIVPAGTNGSVDVFVSNNTDLIIDINGYYAPPNGITLAQGTAAAPALSFSGDTGTGIFSSGAGNVNIATAGTSRLNVDSGGNVGIGTKTPEDQLEVVNPSGATKVTIGGNSGAGGFTSMALGTSSASGGYNYIQSVQSSGSSYGVLALNPAAGNVGIGTTNPQFKLDVAGSLNVNDGAQVTGTNPYLQLYDTSSGKLNSIENSNGNLLFITPIPVPPFFSSSMVIQPGTGNVGIGTTVPGRALDVSDRVRVRGGNAGTAGIFFTQGASTNELGFVGLPDNNHIGFWGSGSGWTLTMDTNTGATATKVLQITGGSDVAEHFEVTEGIQPGMVVAIDPRNPGKLTIARGAYSRNAAGVISGANNLSAGMVLPDPTGAKNSAPVTLSGRVWVYCDATKNAIKPGDLLTTSDTPGHAMKVTNYTKAQGATIGKALTGLKSGRGLVLVLASLQ